MPRISRSTQVGLAFAMLVAACGAGATPTSQPAGAATGAPAGTSVTATQAAATTVPTAATTAAPPAGDISIVCGDVQTAVDAILGPANGATPLAVGDQVCRFQQSGSELGIEAHDASSYDDFVATQTANVASGSYTGPESIQGVTFDTAVFRQVGRPVALVLARRGIKMVQLTYFDGSGAVKADVTKLVDLIATILADQ